MNENIKTNHVFCHGNGKEIVQPERNQEKIRKEGINQ
jgi:hypothetical protein